MPVLYTYLVYMRDRRNILLGLGRDLKVIGLGGGGFLSFYRACNSTRLDKVVFTGFDRGSYIKICCFQAGKGKARQGKARQGSVPANVWRGRTAPSNLLSPACHECSS